MTNAVTLASLANSGYLRNRIINGSMMIDQRNAGASITPSADGTYTLDRWQTTFTAASKFSVQQSTTIPAGFSNSIVMTSTSAYTPAGSDRLAIQQHIEGLNVADLNWGTADAKAVTLSFWVRSSLTGLIGGAINNGSVNRSYPYSFTINSANTWEYKTITIPGDTTGTWASNNTSGIIIKFCLGAVASYRGTSGTWAAANYWGPTSGIDFVSTNGATLYITGVQLEVGTQATPFEWRPFPVELAMCQRYYEICPFTANPLIGGIFTYPVNQYKVQKRTAATITFTGTSNGQSFIDYGGSGAANGSAFRQNTAASTATDNTVIANAEL